MLRQSEKSARSFLILRNFGKLRVVLLQFAFERLDQRILENVQHRYNDRGLWFVEGADNGTRVAKRSRG